MQRGYSLLSIAIFGMGWRLAFYKEITYIIRICVLMTKGGTDWVKLRENIIFSSEFLTIQY